VQKTLNPTPLTPASRKKAGFTHETTIGATVEWYTPSFVLEALGFSKTGRRFTMDVCSPGADKTHVPADVHLTIVEDGLATPWHGTVWMNPPYDRREIATWMDKLAAHGDGIALVFARPDTNWFQAALEEATVVCFVAGRIKFIDGRTGKVAGSPGAGSALFAFGDAAARAVLDADLGMCVTLAS
jgi:hypothetical protein